MNNTNKADKNRLMTMATAFRRLFPQENHIELTKKRMEELIPSLQQKEEILEQIRAQAKGLPLESQFGAIC